jgi:hypothetical protein
MKIRTKAPNFALTKELNENTDKSTKFWLKVWQDWALAREYMMLTLRSIQFFHYYLYLYRQLQEYIPKFRPFLRDSFARMLACSSCLYIRAFPQANENKQPLPVLTLSINCHFQPEIYFSLHFLTYMQ